MNRQTSEGQQKQKVKKTVVHYDAGKDKNQANEMSFAQIQPITIQKSNPRLGHAGGRFEISLDAIPEGELD